MRLKHIQRMPNLAVAPINNWYHINSKTREPNPQKHPKRWWKTKGKAM